MIQLFKKKNQVKNKIFFKSHIGNFKIFFIDNIIIIPNNIQIKIKNQQIYFESLLGTLFLKNNNSIYFFKKQKELMLAFLSQKNKKSILNLNNKLIKIKMRGVLQGFKFHLILKGIGFKSFVEKDKLILKLGYSHTITINIPSYIKIINQSNNLIFSSTDFVLLSQFVHFVKSFKKPEPYKGKGIRYFNEKILYKQGKKNSI